MRYGYRRIHVLLRREGCRHGQNKTRRIYRELGLQLRNKTGKLGTRSMSALTALIETAGFLVERTFTIPGRGYVTATVPPDCCSLYRIDADNTYDAAFYA